MGDFDWVSVIQTAVAVIGFGAVIFQLGQVEKSMRSSARASIYDLAARVKQNIVDNPELRAYFYDAKAVGPEDPNFDKVMAMADFFCLYLEKIATQSEAVSTENKSAWEEYIQDVYANCPAIQLHVQGREDWYSEEFRAIVNI